MDILTDTRYLVTKIYSIVIGHAGIPPKKSVMAMLNSSFQKSWSKWHMVSSLYYSGDSFFNRSIASWGVNTLCTNQLSNDFEKGQTNSICDDDRAKNPY